jgi:hypothetical protein
MLAFVMRCIAFAEFLILIWLYAKMIFAPSYVATINGVAYNYVLVGFEEPWIATLELFLFAGLAGATFYTLTRLLKDSVR